MSEEIFFFKFYVYIARIVDGWNFDEIYGWMNR